MSLDAVDGIVGAILGLFGGNGVLAWIRYRHDKKVGISSDDRVARRDKAEDRRDTIADRDGLIAALHEDVTELRARVDKVEADLDHERRDNEQLRAHIWAGLPPPPPPRPTRAA